MTLYCRCRTTAGLVVLMVCILLLKVEQQSEHVSPDGVGALLEHDMFIVEPWRQDLVLQCRLQLSTYMDYRTMLHAAQATIVISTT